MGQSINRPIGRAAHQAQDQQEPKKRGHRVDRFGCTLALEEWKNYDHVPPAVTSVAVAGAALVNRPA